MSDSDKIRKINRVLVVIILILLLIIFFLLFKEYGKNNNNNGDGNVLHEGKVNVFEIKCDTDCECDSNTKDDSKDSSREDKNKSKSSSKKNDSVSDNTKKVIDIVDDDNNLLDVKIFDKDKKWENQENINIFDNSTYVVNGKIAPESIGTYQFVVKNSTKYNFKYDISFDEDNSYNIDMKYRLRKNNDYVVDNWVTYSELKQLNIRLDSSSSDTYYLEWKWFEGANDNLVGEDVSSKYGLSINVMVVQIND